MIELYDYELSGNGYKVRLLLALLGLEYGRIPVDLRGGGSRTPEFLALNPRGQVPVLRDGERVIWDSMAILVYLARRYGDESWLPMEAEALAEVMQWLAVSENEVLYGLARARATRRFGAAWDFPVCQALGISILEVMDAHLAAREWLCLGRPTVADIACYPYVALCGEAEIELHRYPHVHAWVGRVERLPGYVPMPGLPAGAS